jgi:hypothetical protein
LSEPMFSVRPVEEKLSAAPEEPMRSSPKEED